MRVKQSKKAAYLVLINDAGHTSYYTLDKITNGSAATTKIQDLVRQYGWDYGWASDENMKKVISRLYSYKISRLDK